MWWLLIIGAVIVLFSHLGRRNQAKSKKAVPIKARKEPRANSFVGSSASKSFGTRIETPKKSTQARWVAAGEPVKIGAFQIDSGMFYLGGQLPGQHHGQCGNCVLDPTAKIASSGSDLAGESLSYWPSFQAISPTARRTYLDWLAGGREDPLIGIGYVFLFFYGLERRLFVDNARSDAPGIVAEIQRLLSLHGENNSFKNYANRVLDAAYLMTNSGTERPVLSPDLQTGYEMPMASRVYLGRKLSAKLPLDAEDALVWVLSLPDTNLKTPATRCFDELVPLWKHRFSARHPDGLKVNPPKTRLKLEYRSASNSFTGEIDVAGETGPLPDIAAISAPVTGLRDLLNACTEELAPYSRLLGRNPNARGTLDAALLLPKELVSSAATMDVGRKLDALFDGRSVASATVQQLANALSIDITGVEKISLGVSNQIGGYLDHLDIGFEPDRRYGSSPLRPTGHVVLFKALGGGQVDGEASAFSAARAMVDVAALAAGADDKVDNGEIDAITAEIRNVPELGKIERARLIAYASTLLKDTSLHQFALSKLKTLDAAAKQAVVKSATAAIMADGHASPAEVKFLERLYKAMNLPVDGVYAMLHRSAVVIDEPVAVAAELRSAGVAIPRQPEVALMPSPGTIKIDHSRLERLQSETSAVSQLLAGIFVEEDTPVVRPPINAPVLSAQSRFTGLDAAHAELLTAVLRNGGLGRDQFDDKARALRLLPDGAIERINDWGFDQFDESILEGDDELSIAPHILSELTETEAA